MIFKLDIEKYKSKNVPVISIPEVRYRVSFGWGWLVKSDI